MGGEVKHDMRLSLQHIVAAHLYLPCPGEQSGPNDVKNGRHIDCFSTMSRSLTAQYLSVSSFRLGTCVPKLCSWFDEGDKSATACQNQLPRALNLIQWTDETNAFCLKAAKGLLKWAGMDRAWQVTFNQSSFLFNEFRISEPAIQRVSNSDRHEIMN